MDEGRDYSSFYISMIIILSVILIATSFDHAMEPQKHINGINHSKEFQHILSLSLDGESTTAYILSDDMNDFSYYIYIDNKDCETFHCLKDDMTCFICYENNSVLVEVDE